MKIENISDIKLPLIINIVNKNPVDNPIKTMVVTAIDKINNNTYIFRSNSQSKENNRIINIDECILYTDLEEAIDSLFLLFYGRLSNENLVHIYLPYITSAITDKTTIYVVNEYDNLNFKKSIDEVIITDVFYKRNKWYIKTKSYSIENKSKTQYYLSSFGHKLFFNKQNAENIIN